MLVGMDREELAYQMAYDKVDAEEREAARGSVPSGPRSPQWIELDGPDVLEKLKARMGIV